MTSMKIKKKRLKVVTFYFVLIERLLLFQKRTLALVPANDGSLKVYRLMMEFGEVMKLLINMIPMIKIFRIEKLSNLVLA